MQLQDQRHTTHTLEYNELTATEKDAYAKLLAYMLKYRQCAHCGMTFTLARCMANVTNCPHASQTNNPRDHVDYNTEDLNFLQEMTVPYRLYLVLQTQGIWPEHRYIDKCTKLVMPENNTRQPENVIVHRTCFIRGPLCIPKFKQFE